MGRMLTLLPIVMMFTRETGKGLGKIFLCSVVSGEIQEADSLAQSENKVERLVL